MRKIILGLILVFLVTETLTDGYYFQFSSKNSKDIAMFLQRLFFVKSTKLEQDAVQGPETKVNIVGKGSNKDKEKNLEDCHVCNDVVNRINVLSQYSTEKESMDMVLDKVCGGMSSEYRFKCLALIKTRRREIIEDFMEGVKSKEICMKMKVCRVAKDIDEVSLDKHKKNFRCEICQKRVRQYERLINRTQTPENIQKVFIGICDILKPEVEKLCVAFYKTSGFQAIKDVLKGEKPLKICKDIKMCQGEEELFAENSFNDITLILVNISKVNKGCKNCQKTCTQLIKVIDSTKGLNFVIQKLSAICTLYQTKYQQPCQNYFKNAKVLQYYKSILAHEDPLKICQDFGACHKKTHNSELLAEDQVVSKNHCQLACKLCVAVVKAYEQVLNHSKKPEEIQKVFNGTCDNLQYHSKKACIVFYKNKGFKAIKDMLKGVNPLKICKDIHVCHRRREELTSSEISLDLPTIFLDFSKHDKGCVICVKITKFYERVMNSSKSLDFVIQRFSAICTVYEAKYQVPCQNYFKNPKVLQYYKSVLARQCPWIICQGIDACHKKQKSLELNDINSEETAFLPRFNIL